MQSRREFIRNGALWVPGSALLVPTLGLIAPKPAHALITLISNAEAHATGTSTATTAAADITGAKLLTVVACIYSLSAASVTISSTSNASGAWTAGANFVTSNSNICIWHCPNPATSASETFSCNPNGGGYPTIFAAWWAGAKLSAPRDQVSGDWAASGTTLIVPSITPTENDELIVTGLSNNTTATATINAGFTIPSTGGSQNSNSYETGYWAYRIQTTAAAISPTWTATSGIGPAAAAMQSFKMAAAGAAKRRSWVG
jgi:hypothetical protein